MALIGVWNYMSYISVNKGEYKMNNKYNTQIDIIARLCRTYLWLWHASNNESYLRELRSLRVLLSELRAKSINEYNADLTSEYNISA